MVGRYDVIFYRQYKVFEKKRTNVPTVGRSMPNNVLLEGTMVPIDVVRPNVGTFVHKLLHLALFTNFYNIFDVAIL